jgi:hypothetical protein
LIGLALVGCATSSDGPTTPHGAIVQLPPVPADIQACFRRSVVDVPDRDLSAADIESLWKQDRYRSVVMRNCGQRFLAWYEMLRVNWK